MDCHGRMNAIYTRQKPAYYLSSNPEVKGRFSMNWSKAVSRRRDWHLAER
jgi:hypothetical protein